MLYFLTNDINNPRVEKVITSLDKFYKDKLVILNNKNHKGVNNFNRKLISISSRNTNKRKYFIFKLTFLISRIALSKNDQNFPERNVYSLTSFSFIINFLWKIKIFINDFLPTYNTTLFSLLKSSKISSDQVLFTQKDTFFVDSLLFRNHELINEIKWLSLNSKLISVVVSFDNPCYSQILYRCSNMLVWSNTMKDSLLRFHPFINPISIIETGSLLFNTGAVKNIRQLFKISDDKNVAYGCMFCDEYMLKYELSLILYLSKILHQQGYNLYVRPYPSLDIEFYSSLFNIPNIKLIRSTNKVIIRENNDGFLYDELLSSQIDFLSNCSWFFSLGTSFTIEAAICDMKILQINLNVNKKWWNEIQTRINLSDHIEIYYNGLFKFDETCNLINLSNDFSSKNINMLKKLGINYDK